MLARNGGLPHSPLIRMLPMGPLRRLSTVDTVELRGIASQFEDFLAEALTRKYTQVYGPFAHPILEHNPLLRWSLVEYRSISERGRLPGIES